MRLDFNVLWVDDQPSFISAQIRAITFRMQGHGFDFQPKICRTLTEMRASIADSVFNDEVDLILVDWDLGGQAQGQDAISEIRDRIRYKDVVFYSANKSADELRSLAFHNRLEGVYCVTRVELVEEVVGVFESLIKKVLDIDHVRGIVMGATSDIDAMVSECLASIHDQRDVAGRKKMLEDALKRIDRHVKDLIKNVDKLRTADGFSTILSEHGIFTANDRLRMLSRMLEEAAFEAHASYLDAIKTYIAKVVRDRNRLGHRVLIPADRLNLNPNSNEETMSIEETRALRRLLLDLRVQFRDLVAAIRKSDG